MIDGIYSPFETIQGTFSEGKLTLRSFQEAGN